MLVEVWADVVCPWCYIGKRRLEGALEVFGHAEDVEVRWRSFQLDPTTPRSRPDDPPGTAARLASKYGVDVAEAEAMSARVTEVAAGDGLEYHLDAAVPASTLDAHRLLHAARDHGVPEHSGQDDLAERVMRAYFTEGRRIDDRDTLLGFAVDAGVDAATAAAVLDTDRYADAVRTDQAEAAALGATGVPFVVVDRRYGVSGAQPVEVFSRALEQAWRERSAAATG